MSNQEWIIRNGQREWHRHQGEITMMKGRVEHTRSFDEEHKTRQRVENGSESH